MRTLARTGVWMCIVVVIGLLSTSTGCHSVRREADLARAKAEYLATAKLGTKPPVQALDPRESPPPIRGRARFVSAGKAETDVVVPTIVKRHGTVRSVEGWRAAIPIGELPPATGLADRMQFRHGYAGYEALNQPVGYDLAMHDRVWVLVHVYFLDGNDRWFQRSWFLEGQLGDTWSELKETKQPESMVPRLVTPDFHIAETAQPTVRPKLQAVRTVDPSGTPIRGRARFTAKPNAEGATVEISGITPKGNAPIDKATARILHSHSMDNPPDMSTGGTTFDLAPTERGWMGEGTDEQVYAIPDMVIWVCVTVTYVPPPIGVPPERSVYYVLWTAPETPRIPNPAKVTSGWLPLLSL